MLVIGSLFNLSCQDFVLLRGPSFPSQHRLGLWLTMKSVDSTTPGHWVSFSVACHMSLSRRRGVCMCMRVHT